MNIKKFDQFIKEASGISSFKGLPKGYKFRKDEIKPHSYFNSTDFENIDGLKTFINNIQFFNSDFDFEKIFEYIKSNPDKYFISHLTNENYNDILFLSNDEKWGIFEVLK